MDEGVRQDVGALEGLCIVAKDVVDVEDCGLCIVWANGIYQGGTRDVSGRS